MKKDPLFVVFHACAKIEDPLQSDLRATVLRAYPSIAFCAAVGGTSVFSSTQHKYFINGNNVPAAAKTIQDLGRDQRILLFSFNREMTQSMADEDNVMIVTNDEASTRLRRRPIIVNETAHIPHAMRAIYLSCK